jgi:hypothetical protein
MRSISLSASRSSENYCEDVYPRAGPLGDRLRSENRKRFFSKVDLVGHSMFIYEENIRVPFLVVAPGLILEPIRLRRALSLVDTAPTVLDLLASRCLKSSKTARFSNRDLAWRCSAPTIRRASSACAITAGNWATECATQPQGRRKRLGISASRRR